MIIQDSSVRLAWWILTRNSGHGRYAHDQIVHNSARPVPELPRVRITIEWSSFVEDEIRPPGLASTRASRAAVPPTRHHGLSLMTLNITSPRAEITLRTDGASSFPRHNSKIVYS